MRKILIAMLAAVLFQGCVKHVTCPEEHGPLTNAVIQNTGMIEVDGCDWVVKTDAATSYHADNLPESFKVIDLNVRVRFTLTGTTFTCGWNAKLPVIHITHIER